MENREKINIFKLGNVLTNDGGAEMVVYEVTETFAFLAPFELEDGKIHILTQKTVVYTNDPNAEVHVPVRSITIDDNSAKEVVEAEEPVNDTLENWQLNGEIVEQPAE